MATVRYSFPSAGPHLGDIDMGIADGVTLELLLDRFVPLGTVKDLSHFSSGDGSFGFNFLCVKRGHIHVLAG